MSIRRRLMMADTGDRPMPDYMCLTALAASTVTVTGTYAYNLEYSLDGLLWNTFNSDVTITLAESESAYFRGNNTSLATSKSNYTNFVMSGSLACSGNIMSLLYGKDINGKTTIPSANCFHHLFYRCGALVSAGELKLPATTLKYACYSNMFNYCTSLASAPELPATVLSNYCYSDMFSYIGNYRGFNYVKMLAITVGTTSNSLRSWMYNVQEVSGIFVKHIDATWTTTGQHGVPSKWTIIYYDPSEDKYYTSQDKSQECDDHGNPI